MSGQWAPDPFGRAEFRWWDGATWTAHISTSGQVMQEDAATFANVAVPTTAVDAPAAAVASPVAGFPSADFQAVGFPGFSGFAPHATPSRLGAAPSATTTNAMLVAASVMQLVEGIIGAIVGLWLLAVAQSTLGGLIDDISGGAVTTLGLVIMAFSAGLIVLSVQCMRRRRGAWITTVVFQSIVVVFVVLAFVSALGDSSGDSGAGAAVLPLLYSGAILGLAIVGGRRQFSASTA